MPDDEFKITYTVAIVSDTEALVIDLDGTTIVQMEGKGAAQEATSFAKALHLAFMAGMKAEREDKAYLTN